MKKLFGFAVLVATMGTAWHALHAQPTPPPAPAVISACTGVDEASCGRTEGCTWLPGFKQGTADVPGYCRPSPKSLKARRGTGPGVDGAPVKQ